MEHRLWRALAEAIVDAEAGSEVVVVAGQEVLGFVADAITYRQVRPWLPVVLGIDTHIGIVVVDVRAVQLAEGELGRLIVRVVGQVGVEEGAIRVAGGVLRFTRGAETAAEADEVLWQGE